WSSLGRSTQVTRPTVTSSLSPPNDASYLAVRHPAVPGRDRGGRLGLAALARAGTAAGARTPHAGAAVGRGGNLPHGGFRVHRVAVRLERRQAGPHRRDDARLFAVSGPQDRRDDRVDL